MEVEKELLSFLTKEEEPLQESLDRLTAQYPRLNELDLKPLMMNLVKPLYNTFHTGKYLLPLVLHGMESYLPLFLREGGALRGDLRLRSWIILESLLSRDESLSMGQLYQFLSSWDQGLRRLPDDQTRRNWLDFMAQHMSQCSGTGETFALGRLGAWTLGMAELRLSALQGAERLPEGLIGKILSAEKKDWIEARENPWVLPGPFKGGQIGGFAGYGGPFLLPPQCKKLEGSEIIGSSGLILHDQENGYHLFADSFGCRLIPAPGLGERIPALPEARETPFLTVRLNDESHYLWIERRLP